MIIRIAAMEEELVLASDTIGVLEIEDQQLFCKIVQQLHQQQNNQQIEQQQIIMVQENAIVTLENQLLLFDLFAFPEIIKKQVLKKLISQIQNTIEIDSELRVNWLELQRRLFFQALEFLSPYQIEYDFSEQVELQDFFKAIQFEFVFQENYTPIELLTLLIQLNSQFNLYDRVVIVDCKKYLSETEIKQLYQEMILAKQTLILVESTHDQRRFSFERKLRIYDDFTCEIIENMV